MAQVRCALTRHSGGDLHERTTSFCGGAAAINKRLLVFGISFWSHVGGNGGRVRVVVIARDGGGSLSATIITGC